MERPKLENAICGGFRKMNGPLHPFAVMVERGRGVY
jgi:hypothetical protein